MEYYRRNELYHHGIKGQRWGIRRFQNEDGTLTAAGKKRYLVGNFSNDPDVQRRKADVLSAKQAYKNAKREYNRKTAGGMLIDEQATKDLTRANNNLYFAKQDLSDEKMRKRMEADTRDKSKRRLKLEEEYKARGMNQQEAELAAYKRERTEKALKIAAGIAVTAAVAYGVSKYVENNVDRVIKSDFSLKRVATTDTAGVQDAFYATFGNKKMDNAKYAGLYAKQLKAGNYGAPAKHVYEKTIKTTSALKMASNKSAKSTLQELLDTDPDFRKAFEKTLFMHPPKGKLDKKTYEAFNRQLGGMAKNSAVAKRYYDALSKKGYNAIMDMNDKKYSGFGTNMPVIVFNAKNKVNVSSVRELSNKEINRKNAWAMADIGRKALAPDVAKYGGLAAAAVGAGKYATSKKEQQIVADYKKQHPGTELSYNEIVRNYYNQ